MSAMDYGALVGGAWRMTWRYRGLWWVGFFAGNTGTSLSINTSGNVPSNTEDLDRAFPSGSLFSQANIGAAIAAIQAALPIIVTIGLIVLVVFLAFWLVSIACAAAIISGGAEAAEGRPITLGQAWSTGLGRFGSLFRLQLLLLVFGLIVFGLIAVYVFTSVAAQASQ